MMEPTPPQDDQASSAMVEIGITRIDLSRIPRKLSEVLDEIAPTGAKVKLADVLDTEITVFSVRPFRGQFGPAAFVIFTDDNGLLYNTVVGQKIVLAKLLAAIPYLPVSMTVKKEEGGAFGAYYNAE